MNAVGTLVTTKYSAEYRWLNTSSIHAATHHAIKPTWKMRERRSAASRSRRP